MDTMVARTSRRTARLLAAVCLLGSLVAGVSAPVAASGPNIVAQWNKIAEDTVVGSGAQQIEGMIYMSYTQTRRVRRAGRPSTGPMSRTGRH